MRKIAVVIALLAIVTSALAAQDNGMRPEIRPFAGAMIPTGDQQDLFKTAPTFGAQAALQVRPNLHVVGAFAYTMGENKYDVVHQDVNILQYDLGVELGLVREMGRDWLMKPFIGLGGGARTYVFDAAVLRDRTCTVGYGAVGSEFQVRRVALRLEARDNVFCYRSPIAGGKSKTRNDIGLSLGLAYHLH